MFRSADDIDFYRGNANFYSTWQASEYREGAGIACVRRSVRTQVIQP